MKKALWLCLLLFVSSNMLFSAEINLPEKQNFHIFLLAGQSNMAGRGNVDSLSKQIHPRVLMLTKEGKWVPAIDPIHYDKSAAGVGPGKSFALALVEQDTSIVIGLVPAACGGSPIDTWQPGGYHDQTKSHPYDDAIKRARLAMLDGHLEGILWHQGESDCEPLLAGSYKTKLISLISRFRTDLGYPELPFLIGQMGQFETNPWDDFKKTVNQAHKDAAKEVVNAAFVKSDGLSCRSDNVHFNTQSARELGKRYAKVYLNLKK